LEEKRRVKAKEINDYAIIKKSQKEKRVIYTSMQQVIKGRTRKKRK